MRTLLLLGFILALAGAPPSALAHANYDHSDPAAGAVLPFAPQQVTVWFTEIPIPSQSSLTVLGPGGATVSQGPTQQVTSDTKALRVALQAGLGPGQYKVNWKTVSAEDGDEGGASFNFSVAASPGPSSIPSARPSPSSAPVVRPSAPPGPEAQPPAPRPSALPASGDGSLPPWIGLVVGLAAVIAGLVIRHSPPRPALIRRGEVSSPKPKE